MPERSAIAPGISNQLEFIQGRIPAVVVHRCTSPTNAHWVDLLSSDGLNAFEADLMLPQITEIILIKKPLVDAETKLRKKHFPGVGRERGAAHPAHAVLLATNHKTVEVKVAPIECDLEQAVQRGDAAVAAHMQTAPNRRVDLEEQDVELVNFNRSIWLDHSGPRSLVAADSAPSFSRSRSAADLARVWVRYASGCGKCVEGWRSESEEVGSAF
jgi:hypothetical protein